MQGDMCDTAALGERRERAEDGARRPCGGGQLAADEAYRVLAEVLQARLGMAAAVVRAAWRTSDC